METMTPNDALLCMSQCDAAEGWNVQEMEGIR
jgi:hypothetical protein